MLPEIPEGFEGHCMRCLMRREVCLCDRIPSIETKVRLVIVRHIVERLRPSNTGRLAHLALRNSELLDYGDFDPLDPARLEGEGTWLLYPSPTPPPGDAPPCKRLVVLDGTWKQSRKMLIRLERLHALPRLSLPGPDLDVRRLRQPPRGDGMSTIEAIAGALGALEGEEPARLLRALHQDHVQAVVKLRGY